MNSIYQLSYPNKSFSGQHKPMKMITFLIRNMIQVKIQKNCSCFFWKHIEDNNGYYNCHFRIIDTHNVCNEMKFMKSMKYSMFSWKQWYVYSYTQNYNNVQNNKLFNYKRVTNNPKQKRQLINNKTKTMSNLFQQIWIFTRYTNLYRKSHENFTFLISEQV
jgi:hypothetical protein